MTMAIYIFMYAIRDVRHLYKNTTTTTFKSICIALNICCFFFFFFFLHIRNQNETITTIYHYTTWAVFSYTVSNCVSNVAAKTQYSYNM